MQPYTTDHDLSVLELKHQDVDDAWLQTWLTEGPAFARHVGHLNLTGWGISDDGLQHLATLPSLETLILVDCDVSDAGIARLTALPDLKHLDVTGTDVTNAGKNALRQAFPTIRFEHVIWPERRMPYDAE